MLARVHVDLRKIPYKSLTTAQNVSRKLAFSNCLYKGCTIHRKNEGSDFEKDDSLRLREARR